MNPSLHSSDHLLRVPRRRAGCRLAVGVLVLLAGAAAAAADGEPALTIQPSGWVGIGRGEPKAELDVAGTVRADRAELGALSVGGSVGAVNTLVWSTLAPADGARLDAGAIGRVHLVSPGEGGSRITLPAAAAARGGLVAFVVKPLQPGQPATRVLIEAVDQETLDGRRRLALVHGNALVLLSDGERWLSLVKKVDTDWLVAGPIGLRSTGSQVPKKSANVRTDRVRWRRVGDSMEVIWEYAAEEGGGPGVGSYLFELPMQARVDRDKLTPLNAEGLMTGGSINADAQSLATPVGFGHVSVVAGTEWGSRLEVLAFEDRDPGKPSAVCFTEFHDYAPATTRYLGPGSRSNFGTRRFAVFARATVPIEDW